MGRGTFIMARYVQHYTDQNGKERWYYRRPGFKKIALPDPRTDAFMEAYRLASIGATAKPREEPEYAAESVWSAITAYYQHNSFLRMAPSSRAMRRRILERLRKKHGRLRLATLQRQHVAKLLGELSPFVARNWLKTLRGLMAFAVVTGLRKDDPCEGIKLKTPKSDGHHTWTEDEIAHYEKRHVIGTRARLAMALALYTAARLGDVVKLGPQHVRNGILSYRQQKTGRHLDIPVHPELDKALRAAPSGHLTFLATQAGKSFTSDGFGNLFREYCDQADLPHCSIHGLRKAASRRLAEAGCSASQIAAITGHLTLAEVQRYVAAADQAKLARDAMEIVSRTRIV